MTDPQMITVLGYQSDPWLSSMIGKAAFTVRLTANDVSGKPRGPYFACVRVATADIPSVLQVQREGFYLVDTNVRFEVLRDEFRSNKRINRCNVRTASTDDQEDIGRLAGSAFRFSRFHLDPGFQKEVADTIKAEWARNFFRGLRGKHLLVAETEGHVVGFLLLLNPSPGDYVIDLVGVASEYRGRGIGQTLLSSLWNHLSDCNRVIVGTQVANTDSLRLYEKLGFRITRSEYIFHGHF